MQECATSFVTTLSFATFANTRSQQPFRFYCEIANKMKTYKIWYPHQFKATVGCKIKSS
jgi:hypothetical protein